MSLPNFSSLARLEVPEKFLWWMGGWGVVGWGLHSHYIVKPNLVLRLGWGFDNYLEPKTKTNEMFFDTIEINLV